jgi:hypothetical protein
MGYCPPICFGVEPISTMIALPIYDPSTATAKQRSEYSESGACFILTCRK